jgi:tetratricopeptide (TPR) repeat protein
MSGKFLVTTAVLLVAAPAFGAVQVIGSSSARLCYEAAETQGKPTAAEVERCDTALSEEALTPDDEVATYVNRGILKLRLGRIAEAATDFDSAIRLDPNEPEAYLNRGMAALRIDDGALALSLFDRALAKKTRRPALAYYGRAAAQELSGKLREAYLDYRQASLIEPQWRDPQVELARFTVRPR